MPAPFPGAHSLRIPTDIDNQSFYMPMGVLPYMQASSTTVTSAWLTRLQLWKTLQIMRTSTQLPPTSATPSRPSFSRGAAAIIGCNNGRNVTSSMGRPQVQARLSRLDDDGMITR
jgi:hypothetical protein